MRQTFLHSTSVDTARERWIHAFKDYELSVEEICVTAAINRITANKVIAQGSSPHYAASAMDGFAVKAKSTVGAAPGYPVILTEDVNCFAVDTGDPMPADTDAVIMIEHVSITTKGIAIEQPVSPWQHVRPVGEDIVATEVLLPRFHKVRPVDIGAMLAASVQRIQVLCRPKVAIIPTGDELVSPGSILRAGDIIEFNSHIFRNSLEELGCVVHVADPVPDDRALLLSEINMQLKNNDIVVILAGSSAGRGDFSAEVLSECGELMIHGVAIRPGKPVMLARVQGKPVIGLPGYPVSGHLCLELFLLPLIYQLQHRDTPSGESLQGRLTRRLVSYMGVQEYVRVTVGQVGGQYVVTPLSRGAGVVTSLVKADGYVVVPADSEGFAEGETVSVSLQKPRSSIDGTVVCIGSHDLALDILADHMRLMALVKLSSTHVGSMGGILALRRKESHFAGIHLLDSDSGSYNRAFVERYFAGQDMVLVNLVGRVQGFIVRPGSDINTWHDLLNKRFVNRQRGAGTRLLLDYYLNKEGIACADINGYEREETTHLAVACAVHANEADVGLGILPAASAFNLDFVPLALEQYDLLFYKEDLENPSIAALLEVIRSKEFKSEVEALGGYDLSRTGQIVWQSR